MHSNCQPGRLIVLAAGVLVALHAAARADTPDAAPPPRLWSAEVTPALEACRAGDFVGAQALAQRIAARTRSPLVRQEAAIVEALCLLQMPARSDRLEGRARLKQLAGEDATLLDEPECNLAYGIAQRELSETADALDALERAATAFAAHGFAARQAAALVALARTWARHGEWEATPPRFGVRRPLSVAEARETRRSQIEALRPRIEALPDSDAALAELDLVLATFLLDSDEFPGEGLEQLRRLAATATLTASAAEAAFLLAEQYESSAQWSEALAWYQRLEREWHGEIARQAGRHIQDIARPQIIVDVPGWARPDQTLPVRVRTRNLEAAEVEVRQVDAQEWLNTPGARTSEAFLPESGSVRLARELLTSAAVPHGWWDSEREQAALEFAAGPGAYVVIVRGGGQVVKRLAIVSDLRAACFVGSRHALLWALRPGEPADDSTAEPSAKFWMSRSFVPTELAFEGAVARFALPAEAHVMRERGWVCLTQWGDDLAVCRGSLRPAERGSAAPRVVLLAGPPAPTVGDSLYVSGLVLPAAGANRAGQDAGRGKPGAGDRAGAADTADSDMIGTVRVLDLQVVDTAEDVQFEQSVELKAGGAFAWQVPISAELAGKHLRVLARQDGQALENVLERAPASVPPSSVPDYRLRVEFPPMLPADSTALIGRVWAEYPWGGAVARVRVRTLFEGFDLLALADATWSEAAVVEREVRLDEDGQAALSVPLSDLGAAGRPLAVRMRATARSWDGRQAVDVAHALVASEPPYVWLIPTPAEPREGDDVRFQVGWFGPEGLALATAPEVAVRQGDVEVARLRMRPSREGWTSEPWPAAAPGAHEAAAFLPVFGLQPLVVSKAFEVLPATDCAARLAPLRCQAQIARAGERAVLRVELAGHSDRPLLVMVEDGDPLDARVIPGLPGNAEVVLPLDAESTSGSRVVVVSAEEQGFVVRHIEEVVPDPQEALEIDLHVSDHEVWPAAEAPATVTCRRAGGLPAGTTLTARLIDGLSVGHLDVGPDLESRAARSDPMGVTMVASGAAVVEETKPDDGFGSSLASTTGLRSALSEGVTLWTTTLPIDEESTTFHVQIPAEPGLYKLIVVARTPWGELASDAAILDARHGVRLSVSAPPRLTVGDRSTVAVLVENAWNEPVEAHIRYDAGDGLHVETLYVEQDQRRSSAGKPGEPVTIHLPTAGRAWLHLGVEAARVASGHARAEVAVHGRHQTAQCPYQVQERGAVLAPGESLNLRRTVMVWAPPPGAAESEQTHDHGQRGWISEPLLPDTRLMPGAVLEVAEEFTVREATPEVEWRQPIPPTCRSVLGQSRLAQPIGARQPDLTGTLVFQVPELAPGEHVHRYLLVVVRPGVAAIPTPELRCGDAVLPAVVEPADLKVVVPDAR